MPHYCYWRSKNVRDASQFPEISSLKQELRQIFRRRQTKGNNFEMLEPVCRRATCFPCRPLRFRTGLGRAGQGWLWAQVARTSAQPAGTRAAAVEGCSGRRAAVWWLKARSGLPHVSKVSKVREKSRKLVYGLEMSGNLTPCQGKFLSAVTTLGLF